MSPTRGPGFGAGLPTESPTSSVSARPGIHSPEDRRFVGLAEAAIDDYLARNSVHATNLGDHRFDSRLPDLTADGVAEHVRALNRHLAALDSLDTLALSRVNGVDLAILRNRLGRRIFELRAMGEQTWNPLLWNPGETLYGLLMRPAGPPEVRLRAAIARMRALGEFLDSARLTLRSMPRIHVQTAISQASGLPDLLGEPLQRLAAEVPALAKDVAEVRAEALTANEEHIRWLRSRIPSALGDPRLGPDRYRAELRFVLGADADPDELLAAAEAEVARLGEEMHSIASRLLGRSMATRRLVKAALTAQAEESSLRDADGLLGYARESLQTATRFAQSHGLVAEVPNDISVEWMPQVRRGVVGAYCEAPGSLEQADLPTVIALAQWNPAPGDRRDTLHTEYAPAMIDVLMVHEGIPGHAHQLRMAREHRAPTQVRGAFPDSVFIEGWAAYAEQLMADHAYPGARDGSAMAFRLMQLKMRLRIAINAILDIRFHTRGMTEAEARRLMAVSGFQAESEVARKWDRVQLTHTQLTTYFAGLQGVTRSVAELSRLNPAWRPVRVHQALLSHGSIAPAHLESLLGLV